MSDTLPQPDYVQERIARDQRFAILARAIAVEADLRDNETIKALMGAVRADAEQAMEDIANTSPADISAMSLLFTRVSTLVYIKRTLNTIIHRGQLAEQAIRMEDETRGEDE